MRYYDCDGQEILAGMHIRMEDGSVEEVFATTDAYGNEDLGINASNEAYLELHPFSPREYYPLSNFNLHHVQIVDQTESMGLSM